MPSNASMLIKITKPLHGSFLMFLFRASANIPNLRCNLRELRQISQELLVRRTMNRGIILRTDIPVNPAIARKESNDYHYDSSVVDKSAAPFLSRI